MKKLAVVLLLGLPVIASASNCDEISANIAEKIKNNGVNENSFQLKLVPQDEQNIEEGRRLFYVAITRPRKELHILYTDKMPYVTRYISELDNSLYNFLDYKKEYTYIPQKQLNNCQ